MFGESLQHLSFQLPQRWLQNISVYVIVLSMEVRRSVPPQTAEFAAVPENPGEKLTPEQEIYKLHQDGEAVVQAMQQAATIESSEYL